MGPALGSRGFILGKKEIERLREIGPTEISQLRPLVTGRDLTNRNRQRLLADFSQVKDEDFLRQRWPHLYQHLRITVWPVRARNKDAKLRREWWRFRRSNEDYFSAIEGLPRYIATVETTKHRVFSFVGAGAIVEHGVVGFGSSDALLLALLSSRAHVAWTLAVGGTLEDRPRYNKTVCFDPFPFPDLDEALKEKLRAAGEELDATRKRVLEEHPDLTLTGLYNVLERVRAIEAAALRGSPVPGSRLRVREEEEVFPLSEKEEDIKTRGLVLILKELHDTIDRLTEEAYDWPADLSDQEILERLVALNAERAKEEAAGQVRWLRPDYQVPRFAKKPAAKTEELALGEEVVAIDKGKPVFPRDRYEQALAVEAVLSSAGSAMDAAEIARMFKRGGKRVEQRVAQVLVTLARYGRVSAGPSGRYSARRAA